MLEFLWCNMHHKQPRDNSIAEPTVSTETSFFLANSKYITVVYI